MSEAGLTLLIGMFLGAVVGEAVRGLVDCIRSCPKVNKVSNRVTFGCGCKVDWYPVCSGRGETAWYHRLVNCPRHYGNGPPDAVAKVAQARVWLGIDAKEKAQ